MLQELLGLPVRAGSRVSDFWQYRVCRCQTTQTEVGTLNLSHAETLQDGRRVGIRFSYRSTTWIDIACCWKCRRPPAVSTTGLHTDHLLTPESVCIIAVG